MVASGTAAAQAITMAFSPVITRLYGPEAFGVLGVFIAIISFIRPIAALSYPIAIVLPKSDADAKGLIRLSLYTAIMVSVISLIILMFTNEKLLSLLQLEVIAPFVYLIPIVILFSAILQVTQQWLIRTRQFRITAKIAILQSIILNFSKMGIGWFNPVAAVLVILSTAGSVMHALLLILGANRSKKKPREDTFSRTSLRQLARKYKDFPLFRAPQVFINAVSQSMPVLLLASFFGPASVGYYSIGKSVLGMPTQLIGKSVADVFYPRITDAANNGEILTHLIAKATLALASVGIIPFGLIVIFGPWLFEFFFGSDWRLAGEYARWQSLWLFFSFLNRPSIAAIPVLNMQGSFLIYEIVSVAARATALALGFLYYKNDIYTVAIFSVVGAVLNLFLIFFTLGKSRNFNFYKVSNKETEK